MAKYTDPNTGVKYSTHTGLKVFAVIVVILLVISIVLNVLLYMQNSDGELGAETGANDEGDEDGEDGVDAGVVKKGEFGVPVFGEGIVDTETIVENDNAADITEFDENGVATCTYNYGEDCLYCGGVCEGHKMYITTGGGTYEYYPVVSTQVLVAEDGSTDINSKIRASLVFYRDEYDEYDLYLDDRYFGIPNAVEIVSLTGDPLEIESVESRQYIYYENVGSIFNAKYAEHHTESGIEIGAYSYASSFGNDASTDYTKVYNCRGAEGFFTVSINMSGGSVYIFDYWCIDDIKMLEAEVIEDDEAD